jgi:hypothetical protein
MEKYAVQAEGYRTHELKALRIQHYQGPEERHGDLLSRNLCCF